MSDRSRDDAARGVEPRPSYVADLEAHLRRQPPTPVAPVRGRWNGFRAAILATVVALALGAVILTIGMVRAGDPLTGSAPTPTPAASAPATVAVPTAVVGVAGPAGGAAPAVAATALAAHVPGWLADPTVIYLLLTLGALAVLLEVLHPGAFVPGVVGAGSLLLAVVGLLAVPLNWGGLLLLVVALALVAVDIVAAAHGALTLAAIVAFVPGSLLLFAPAAAQPPGHAPDGVALPAVLGLTALLGAFGLVAGAAAAQVRTIAPYAYALPEGGMTGTAVGPLGPTGVVRVGNQLWSARTEGDPIAAAQPICVVAREGLTLIVQPLNAGASGESEFPDVGL